MVDQEAGVVLDSDGPRAGPRRAGSGHQVELRLEWVLVFLRCAQTGSPAGSLCCAPPQQRVDAYRTAMGAAAAAGGNGASHAEGSQRFQEPMGKATPQGLAFMGRPGANSTTCAGPLNPSRYGSRFRRMGCCANT